MTDRGAVALALAAASAAFVAPAVPPAACLLFVALWAVCRRPVLLAVAVVLLVAAHSAASLAALEQPLPERVEGRAQLASDPEDQRFDTRFVVRIDGRRYLAQLPRERAAAVRSKLTGEWVHVRGRPQPLRSAPAGWVRSQHLAGRLAVSDVADAGDGPWWYRVANGVHRSLGAGARPFGEHRSLYLGLVIGDDRGQDDLTRFQFEAAGLTHLLAVSGSNVAFVLTVVAPLMERLGRRGRVVLAAALLIVFVLVTRAEPSVLRASVMAAFAITAVALGRVAPAKRVLAVTVTLLLVVDPLLVHSVGFQLSVAATAGLMTLSQPIMDRLPGPRWLVAPLSVTLAAQLATAPLLVALSGGLPSSATLANLLAGPAAGLVMMLGVTAGMLAGHVGDATASLLQLPAVLLVRWIAGVADVSSRLPLGVLEGGELVLLSLCTLTWRWARWRPAGLLLVVGVVLAIWPSPPGPGRHRLGDGVELHVGRCGGTALTVDGAGGHLPLLRALWWRDVRHLDVLVVSGSRADAAAAVVLGEQFAVGRTFTVAERAPPRMEPLGSRQLWIGDLRLFGRADPSSVAALIEPDQRRCTLAP